MKKYLYLIIFWLVSFVGYSQKGISYQAVILDPNKIEIPGQDITGQPYFNAEVWVKFQISTGPTLQFEEVHKTQTDAYGLVNLLIGSVSSASFNSLVWDTNQKSLQVSVSFNKGASYSKVSDQKLTYVPYSFYAESTTKLIGILPISSGGTGASTVADAKQNFGLDQVNNTSDLSKPISAATQAALDLKANAIGLTNEITRATASELALTNQVNANTASITSNTADLLLRATSASPSFTGTPTAPTAVTGTNTNQIATTAFVTNALGTISAGSVSGTISVEQGGTGLTSVGAFGQVLTSSANGTLTWTTPSVGGGGTTLDADANTKGKIQLAGDLGGIASAPTVPGLALKANTVDMNTALALKASAVNLTNEITRATAAELVLTNNVNANTTSITALLNTPITYASISGPVPTWNQNTTGNAATATSAGTASTSTKLITARNINGVAFDGSADITVTADAGTLTGTTLKSTVTGSSLTSVGTLTSLEVNGRATNSTAFNASSSTTIDFTKSNLAYTSNNPGAFTLSGLKDGGTFTLAVQGTTAGTSSFTSGVFTFLSVNNGVTTSGKHTLYTFIVMGNFVYYFMTAGF